MQHLQFGVATKFLCRDNFSVLVLVATLFLILSEFLLQPRKSVATEFCRHLT